MIKSVPARAVRWLPLDEMLAGSQLQVVVIPLSDETRGLLDARRLAQVPEGAASCRLGPPDVARAIKGEPARNVVNGLGPLVERRAGVPG